MSRFSFVEDTRDSSLIQVTTEYKSKDTVGKHPVARNKRRFTTSYPSMKDAFRGTLGRLGWTGASTVFLAGLTTFLSIKGIQDIQAHQNILATLTKDPITHALIETPYPEIWNNGLISGMLDVYMPVLTGVTTVTSATTLPRAYGEFSAVSKAAKRHAARIRK